MKRVKGFTLVEMVVVIAIIGILVGVLTPSMMAYIRQSRIQTANSDAKMVYNAAQTEVQKYIARDRAAAAANQSGLGSTAAYTWISYTPASSTYLFAAAPGNSLTAVSDGTATGDASGAVVAAVNRQVSGANEVCWAVCVKNYIVQGAVSAPAENSVYVGYYSNNKQKATDDNLTTNYNNTVSVDGTTMPYFMGKLKELAEQY